MSIIETNLRLLRVGHPELAQRLEALAPDGSVTAFASKSGHPVARARDETGGEVLLASEYDPIVEAERFMAAQKLDEREAYAILGFGMGYHLLEILNHLGKDHYFLVVEKDPQVMRMAIEQVDFTPLFDSGRFVFFCGDDRIELSAWFTRFLDHTFVEDITVVRHTASMRLYPSFYPNVMRELETAANRRIVDLATSISWSKKFQGNILANALNVSRAGGVGPLAGKLAGVPAILVAAGPSLDKNVELLSAAKGKAILICVGTVFKKLLATGARPDVVVSMDPSDRSQVYFEDTGALDDVVLVADPEVYPPILDEFSGGKLIIDVHTPATEWLKRWVGEKGLMVKGRTVAHTAFFFARHLGCDPIAFVGLDLALSGDHVHASGCNEGWGEGIKPEPDSPDYIWIDGADGAKVPTMRNFLNFLTIFETEVAATAAQCIDATEGGALKRGMDRMPLQEVLSTYCGQEHDVASVLRAGLQSNTSTDLPGLHAEVRRVHKQAQNVEQISQQGLKLISKVLDHMKARGYDETTLRPLFTKINDLHHRAHKEETAMTLLQRHLVNTRIFFQSRKVKQIEEMEMGQERMTLELSRSKRLLGDLVEAAGFLTEELAKLDRRMGDELSVQK